MIVYVTLQGEEFEVELARGEDGHWRASLEGRTVSVQAASVQWGVRYSVLLDEQSFDVMAHGRDPLQLTVKGHTWLARVEDERQRAARRIASHAPQGPVTVESQMPGILREVRVKPGDTVSVGQTLLILEAMKMENEVIAEQGGVVGEVFVKPGQAVEGGVPLVALEPPADSEPK